MKLKKKVALVTGSSRSIGKGIAQALAKEGALVVINYASNQNAAEATIKHSNRWFQPISTHLGARR